MKLQSSMDRMITAMKLVKPVRLLLLQKRRKRASYNYIASISPLLSELMDKAPKLESVEVPGGRRVELPTAEEDVFKVEEA